MSASGDLYRCPTCGASLSLEQLRGTDCPFCHTVFPHHGAAVQQAALVNQVLAQQYHQAGYGGPPPQVNAQYGAPPPQHFNPYGNANQQIQQSLARSAKITIFVFVAIVIMMIVLGAVMAIFFAMS
jgi:hypothetical protein